MDVASGERQHTREFDLDVVRRGEHKRLSSSQPDGGSPCPGEISVAAPNMSLKFYQIKDVCRGLAYLHSRGIVHGDIKPVSMRSC